MNTWRRTAGFAKCPWLLDFFDQIRFYPVSHDELTEARAAFPHGGYPVRIEETRFNWAREQRLLTTAAGEIAAFKSRQQAAFDDERLRWKEAGLDSFVADVTLPLAEELVPAGCTGVESPVPGTLWKCLVEPGDRVAAGEPLVIVESMKMEIVVVAPAGGRILAFRAVAGRTVRAGDILAVMETT